MNDGMVLKVPFKQDGSVLQIGDKEYTPVEAIVRSPSEHKLDGKAYDMEMQVMHKDSLGNQIGISVLMEVTDKLPKEFYIENVFGHFFSNLPKSGNQRRIESMNLKWILSEKMLSHYVQYHGSLTHPPCSEGVEWFVLGKPWLIEKKWLQNYKTVLSDNARPVNDQNDRVLTSF
jgi:carbonic anhydrase